MINYSIYLSKKCINKLSSSPLNVIANDETSQCNKLITRKSMLIASVLVGLLGGDRFMLGDRRLGILKCSTWVFIVLAAAITHTMLVGYLISYAISEFGVQSSMWYPTVTEVINAVGLPLFVSACVATVMIVIYAIVGIIDIVFCYNKAIKNNLKILSANSECGA